MKDKIKATPICNTPKPLKIKEGRVTITLEDKHGKKTVVDHNMMTDAMDELLADCGWLNRDNLPQDNLVPELLGGIMLFNDEIDDDPAPTYVPSGLNLVANGAVGTTNTGTPYELGSCSDIATETGWQSDGSYLMTFRWDENHGNGTIASVGLTQKQVGFAGCGNPSGDSKSGARIDNIYNGTATPYVLRNGYAYHTARVSIKDSTAYCLDLSDISNGNITIEQYRIPTRKVNLKGSTTAPVLLDSTTITTEDSTLIAVLTAVNNGGEEGWRSNYFDAYDHFWVWNAPTSSGDVWGTNYTQYLWDINVVSGTITTYTVLNTSGDTLHGIFKPIFIGSTMAFVNGYFHNYYSRDIDTSKIYQFTISNGAAGAITSISNTLGWTGSDTSATTHQYGACNGKVIVITTGRWFVYDIDGTVYPINADATSQSLSKMQQTDCQCVMYENVYTYGSTIATFAAIQLRRTIDYLATVYNLQNPVTKDATKTMTVVYRLTFEEEEEENE